MQYNIIHDKKQSEMEKIPIEKLLMIFEIRFIIND
jgi:hypothetical protein